MGLKSVSKNIHVILLLHIESSNLDTFISYITSRLKFVRHELARIAKNNYSGHKQGRL